MSHVQKIKKKFEDLKLNNELDFLVDIAPLRIKKDSVNNSFQRSATLFEFSSSPNYKNNINSEKIKQEQDNFQRQHSNDSPYKSLRRSQAFRLDVQKKPSLTKTISPVTTKLKRQNAIKHVSPCSKTSQFDELQYLATSETIKKALKQPLPQGPAPKKPPRTFTSSPKTSPINENSSLLDAFERAIKTSQQNAYNHKIIDIERRTTTLPKASEKKDDKKGISSFLNCIINPCSIDPIYYEQIRQERKHFEGADEKIYMEPFEHLNFMKIAHENPKTELHYMCTNLIDQTNNNSSFNQNDINTCSLDSNNVDSSDLESYEKINLLMDVVYDEKHRDNIIEESSGSSERESKSPTPRVTRSLTEKRKNYVRRMTEEITLKDFNLNSQTSSTATSIISQFQRIIDSNKLEKPKRMDTGSLFKMILLIGYDMMNQKGYVKSIYPKTQKPLPMIEQFVYPSTKHASDLMTKENQNFTLILTDEFGNNLFGYCRQIVAEGFDEKCLPLTYCIITKTSASGFYFQLLKEIESRHGYPEVQFTSMMRSLYSQEMPKNGQVLHVKLLDRKLPEIPRKPDVQQKSPQYKNIGKRLSLESPEWLKTEATMLLQNKSNETVLLGRSHTENSGHKKSDEIVIKRSNDVRLQNEELTVLYESTTKELLVMIFGTLLIERKVILLGTNVSQITSCVAALYSILYPFQWHHIVIALIPEQIIELLTAPFPFFAGVLKTSVQNDSLLDIEDGIVVDLETKSLLKKCGDEQTLVPETLKKSLLLSLKIVEAIDKGEKLKNVLIAEAFLQYFIKLFSKFDARSYNKNKFIEAHEDQAIRYFLEWFLDTIMFTEFVKRKKCDDLRRESSGLVSSEMQDYFELFNIKILEKSATLSDNQQRKNVEMLMKSSNKQKKRNFKDKIKDFLKS